MVVLGESTDNMMFIFLFVINICNWVPTHWYEKF